MDHLTIKIPYFLEPTIESFGGIGILTLQSDFNINPVRRPNESFRNYTIKLIFKRAIAVLSLLICNALDLAMWAVMTVTIIPAYSLGRQHWINLISFLALPILSFGIMGGYTPRINYAKKSHSTICSCLEGVDKLNLSKDGGKGDVERFIDINPSKEEFQRELVKAASVGHYKAVEMLLKQKLDLKISRIGTIALSYAIRNCQSRVVELLLTHQIEPDQDSLSHATLSLSPISVIHLLNHGANPNFENPHKSHLVTLMMAGLLIDETYWSYHVQKGDAIRALIMAEAECLTEHLEEVEKELLPALTESNAKQYAIGNAHAINAWIIGTSGAAQPLCHPNPFRSYLQQSDLQLDEGIFTNPPNSIFAYDPLYIQQNRKVFAQKFPSFKAVIIQAKHEVAERRYQALIDLDYFPTTIQVKELARLISEYVYS